ncbi:MAG TPA: chloride channel protein [Acidimicrobiales bacterium]
MALALAAAVGVLTGVGVAVFDWLVEALLDEVLAWPLWLRVAAPTAGLAAAGAALRWLAGGATPATADEYIRNFHDPMGRLDLRAVPGRIVAAVATLGLGGSLGYEGPSIYGGAAIGSGVQRRLSRFFGPDDAKVLMVAGAAAGVAAIFKAPVTGLVFALEVPYREDLARRMLLPAGIAAAASYLMFASLAGTEPLLPIAGDAPFDLRDLGGAAALGLVAGAGARLAATLLAAAKRLARRGHQVVRVVAAGAALAGLFLAGRGLGIDNPTLGPGYDAVRWALDPDRTVLAVAALAGLRLAATATTLAGGGTGGLFIPLVVQGALLGRMASGIVDPPNPTLFPVVGIAAFLGAGYRVPLAGVVFVAEFTGRPGFVVPGLIAALVAQLTMGPESVSPYQAPGRPGHLERRLTLPITDVVDTAAATVPPDATVSELFWQHFVGGRRRSVAVVDGTRYLGMARAEDLASLDRATWATTTVAAVAHPDHPTVRLDQRVDDALRAMDEADTDRVAVLDQQRFVGTVSLDDIVRLDDVIDRARFGTGAAG